MGPHPKFKAFITFLAVLVVAFGLSVISVKLWGGKAEKSPEVGLMAIEPDMTLGQFAQANNLPNPVLKEIFQLKTKADLDRPLSDYGTADEIRAKLNREMALTREAESKNWVKIPLKFGLWLVSLLSLFLFLRKRKLNGAFRKWLLFISLLVFGVALGSDPGPMGTVKDAIHLYGKAGVIFPPRMVALGVFLLSVFLANKYICAWGCQAGTLQDLIFRINQGERQKAVFGRQIKLPFVFTNTVRVLFLGVFTVAAFRWGTDIIDPIDPFKVYKPMMLGLSGGIFVALLLLASLFVYRPWCHLFCPFGLAGWLVEKISRVRISVDYGTCIACEKCARVCPSTVMGAILKRDKKTIPDCFSCYACVAACPTGAVRFSARKRTLPPAGHFGAGDVRE